MKDKEVKKFHIAYWTSKEPKELTGANYNAKDMSIAIEMYIADPTTPELSKVKYVFEIGPETDDIVHSVYDF